MHSPIFRTPSFRFGLAALSLLAGVPAALRADDNVPPSNEAPQLSDAVGDGLAKLKEFLDAKDYTGAMNLMEGLRAKAEPDSYDQAFIYENEARIMTQKGDFVASIGPLEKSLEISDRHHFNTVKQNLDILYFLSQLYYQQADNAKTPHDEQVADFQKAIGYIERWFTLNPKPSEDISYYYSQLIYAEALAISPAGHPDKDLIRKAQEQVEKTIAMSPKAKDSYYVFLLATLQQLGDYPRSAEILELLLAHNPSSKTYWQDLTMFYMAMAQNDKDKNDRKIKTYNIRAINTIERAQAHGYMTTPRDNYTLFSLYFNAGQYGKAADLLYEGLKSGGIDSTLANWLLLASSYQQINQDFTAIEALKEASNRFPKNGEIDFKIGQVYQELDRDEDAYPYYKSAVDKGGLGKPLQALLFLAYSAYELHKFDDAKVAIDRALELEGAKPDHQAQGLKNAIEDAIKEREAKKAEAAAPAAQ